MKHAPCLQIRLTRSTVCLSGTLVSGDLSPLPSHWLCSERWVGKHHDLELRDQVTCWCCLGDWPKARAAGQWIQDRIPGRTWWPPWGLAQVRERGCTGILVAGRGRLILSFLPILILGNMACATGSREGPRGSIFNIIFWNPRRLKCLLAWNTLLRHPESPNTPGQADPLGPYQHRQRAWHAEGDSTGRAGTELGPGSQPPACKDAASI